MAPYRVLPGPEVFEAWTRVGKAKLGVEPRITHLELPKRVKLSITESYLMIQAGRKPRRLPLAETRILLARAFPTNDLGLWCERAGVAQRLAGLESPPLLDARALDRAHELDRLGERLETAPGASANTARAATASSWSRATIACSSSRDRSSASTRGWRSPSMPTGPSSPGARR